MEPDKDVPRTTPRDAQSLIHRRAASTRVDDIPLDQAQRDTIRAIAQSARPADAGPTRGAAHLPNKRSGVMALILGADRAGRESAAAAVATELDVELYRVDLSQVVSKYIGETEKNLRAVFDAAEKGGAVLLFDEADALFGKRTEVKDAHDRYANIETGYLLERLESYSGVALLATNLKSNIDPAFTRRIRYIVDLPDTQETRT